MCSVGKFGGSSEDRSHTNDNAQFLWQMNTATEPFHEIIYLTLVCAR